DFRLRGGTSFTSSSVIYGQDGACPSEKRRTGNACFAMISVAAAIFAAIGWAEGRVPPRPRKSCDLPKTPDVKRPTQPAPLEISGATLSDNSDYGKYRQSRHELNNRIRLVGACRGHS